MNYFQTLALIISIAVISSPILASPRTVIQSWSGQIRPATPAITITISKGGSSVGGDVQIWSTKKKFLWSQQKLNPWKLCIVDIDGDGAREILVGVEKKSLHDPVMAKRLFIYKWNGKRLLPLWLSSRLTRRFSDFTAADIDKDGKAEVFSLEVAENNTRRISLYKKAPFGLEWIAASENIAGLKKLSLAYKPGVSIIASGTGRKWSLKTIVQGDTIMGLNMEEIK